MKNIFLTLIIFLVIGCNQKKEIKSVAQVNDDILTLEELKSPFTEEQWKLKSIKKQKALVQNWIDLTVLAQAADTRKISLSPEVSFRIENSIKTVKANSLIAQKINEIEVTENDLFDYYKLHQNRYKKSYKEYKIQRIFTENLEATQIVFDAINNGMKFTDAAKKYSKEKIGRSGGYFGFLPKEKIEPEIWEKIISLKKWRYDKVNTSKGFYIVRYYEKRDVEIDKKFNEVKKEIRKNVLEEKQNKLYNQLIDEMKKETEKIIISI